MFFNLFSNPLRSLTAASPITTALDQAHKMAQRRLADGGAARTAQGSGGDSAKTADFLLPKDIDPVAVAVAVRRMLGLKGSTSDDPLHPLERRLGGRLVLHGRHILRLGDGRYDLGRAYMRRFIHELRLRRPSPVTKHR